jgi:hypothetical protein
MIMKIVLKVFANIQEFTQGLFFILSPPLGPNLQDPGVMVLGEAQS